MRKVSENCQDLVVRGLLDAGRGRTLILASALATTLSGQERTVSAEVLTRITGLSAEDLAQGLDELRALGFAVVSAGSAGYRLAEPFDDLLVPEAVLSLLLERMGPVLPLGVGLPYRYYESCGSTSQSLKAVAVDSPPGTLVVTDGQLEGRGRLGRTWSCVPGQDLTFSVLLRPSLSPEDAPLLSLAAALAVAEVLEGIAGMTGRVRLKWPNDVLVDGRKICGILLESSLDGSGLRWVVVGIGLNVNSDPASYLDGLGANERREWSGKPLPTSLLVERGVKTGRGGLLAELLPRLSGLSSDVRAPDFLDRVRTRDALSGRRLEVYAGPPDGAMLVSGESVGIGLRGELLVRNDHGETMSIVAGEVTLSVDS